jgi:hypothetical protein
MAPTPEGSGYWLATADGGVFAFGAADFFGSLGGNPPAAPVAGIAPVPDGRGYWLAGTDALVFAFGSADFHGSAAGSAVRNPIVGVAASGEGYVVASSGGEVLSFGTPLSASPPGTQARTGSPVVAVAV